MSYVEVDQSGKIEDLRQDTVVAFSNGDWSAVKVSRKVKREIFQEHRSRVKKIVLKLFAVCIFYLLENYIERKESVVICKEYWGWEQFIKRELLELLSDKVFDKQIIRFGLIGKSSAAHHKALQVNRKKLKPTRDLTKEELIKYLN